MFQVLENITNNLRMRRGRNLNAATQLRCPPLQIPVDREEQFSLGTVVCSQENPEDS